MPFSDFLFNGQTPPAITTDSNSGGSVPLWYSSYLSTLANNAANIASQPYQSYNAPRIASQDPQEQQAYQYLGANADNWQSGLQQAQGVAGNVAANGIDPNSISRYMSPYMSNVTSEIARLGNQNLNENLMPALNDQFIGAGQFGSDRNRTMDERLVRDVGANISGQQGMALQGGFQNASTLANQSASLQNQGAQNLGGLSQMQQALTTGTAGALSASGATNRGYDQANLDLGYQDFLNQSNFPRQNVSFLSSVLRGTQVPTSQDTQTTGPFNGTMSSSPLATFAGLSLAGLGMSRNQQNLGTTNTPQARTGGYVANLARGGRPLGGLSLVRDSMSAPRTAMPVLSGSRAPMMSGRYPRAPRRGGLEMMAA